MQARPLQEALPPAPFSPGSMVVVTLGNPRDKFWGMILALAPEGLSLSGVELASFEDLVVMVKDGEPFTPAVVFFPMHRIERIELDLPDGKFAFAFAAFLGQDRTRPSRAAGRSPAGSRSPEPAFAAVSALASARLRMPTQDPA